MKKRFQGRVAFITGGGQGIGKAITEEFAAQGAKVAVIDSNETVLVKTAEELTGKGYDVYTKVANVVDPEEVETAMNEVVKKFGSLDRSEEHTSELQSRGHLVCRLLLEKKKKNARTG